MSWGGTINRKPLDTQTRYQALQKSLQRFHSCRTFYQHKMPGIPAILRPKVHKKGSAGFGYGIKLTTFGRNSRDFAPESRQKGFRGGLDTGAKHGCLSLLAHKPQTLNADPRPDISRQVGRRDCQHGRFIPVVSKLGGSNDVLTLNCGFLAG